MNEGTSLIVSIVLLIGATFFVIGVGFLYMATGSLNMEDIWQRTFDLENNRTIKSAYAFIAIGMGLKVAMFPLHLWLPNSYTYAPSVVTAFLAATAALLLLAFNAPDAAWSAFF